MLALMRKIGERIMIVDNIVIEIVDIAGGKRGGARKVKIGIEAPREIRILRP